MKNNPKRIAHKAEVVLRVQTIAEMIIKGLNSRQIVQHSAENWNIEERQTRVYIHRAKKIIEDTADKHVERNVALAIARYNDLFQKNYKIQDYRECRQVQESINQLLGLNSAKKIAVEHTNADAVASLFDKIDKEIE